MSGYFEVVGEDEGSGEGFGDEVFCSVIFLFILIYYNNEISPRGIAFILRKLYIF